MRSVCNFGAPCSVFSFGCPMLLFPIDSIGSEIFNFAQVFRELKCKIRVPYNWEKVCLEKVERRVTGGGGGGGGGGLEEGEGSFEGRGEL